MSREPLRVVPVTRAQVRLHVEREHSHHHKPNTWVAALGVASGDRLACVVVLEIPKARLLCDGLTGEISRVASDRTPHAASKGIAAMSRAALALGYRRLVSYTLLGEAGTSYTAAGWWPTAISAGGSWDRPSRPVAHRDSIQKGAKVRWEFGPDAAPRNEAVARSVADMAGIVDIPARNDSMPLFGAGA